MTKQNGIRSKAISAIWLVVLVSGLAVFGASGLAAGHATGAGRLAVGLSTSPHAARGPSGNSNSSNSSLSNLLSNAGAFLRILLIGGIILFVTWILLVAGIWVIAVVLMRRLPKPGAPVSAVYARNCAACSSPMPASAKFCPECGKSTAAPPS